MTMPHRAQTLVLFALKLFVDFAVAAGAGTVGVAAGEVTAGTFSVGALTGGVSTTGVLTAGALVGSALATGVVSTGTPWMPLVLPALKASRPAKGSTFAKDAALGSA